MNSNKDKIDQSQLLFTNLIGIVERNSNGELSYQISEIHYILQLLSKCVENNYEDADAVLSEVKEIHKKIYPPRGGLSDFFIWKSDYDERVKANEPFERISDELWQLLQQA